MSIDENRRLTMRCSIHGISWPYSRSFLQCPLCGEDCSALRLKEEDVADILTHEQANAVLREHGLREIPEPVTRRIKRMSARELIHRLHDDLDSWAKEAPPWAK
jgi:hypothetical protein